MQKHLNSFQISNFHFILAGHCLIDKTDSLSIQIVLGDHVRAKDDKGEIKMNAKEVYRVTTNNL